MPSWLYAVGAISLGHSQVAKVELDCPVYAIPSSCRSCSHSANTISWLEKSSHSTAWHSGEKQSQMKDLKITLVIARKKNKNEQQGLVIPLCISAIMHCEVRICLLLSLSSLSPLPLSTWAKEDINHKWFQQPFCRHLHMIFFCSLKSHF